MIPAVESIPESDFGHFLEFSDSDSDSNSIPQLSWFQFGIDSSSGIDSSDGIDSSGGIDSTQYAWVRLKRDKVAPA